MTIAKKMMGWLAVPALLAAVSPAAARTDGAEKCVFEQYAAISVAPYSQEEDFGLGTYTQLRGAQVYVAAEPGLTAEWLTLRAQRSLDSGACGPSVQGVTASATSAGGGFWLAFSAPNIRSAKSVLAWAQGVVPGSK